ncbi:MAG TPA: PepSY-associated TM helix domain-containing protein, partial [Nitrosomonas sp.]|nr:PepSY-associated TM helix domain-containing protein [Nitrosomonas sp.]
GDRIPGSGSAGDIFLDAQFPLHSGRILGLPGRIMISILGLLVAMLSVTGIIIWQRKRWARARIVNQR